MKKIFVVSVVLLLLVSASSCEKKGAEIGSKAPDFTLKDINGNTVSLSHNGGKAVMVKFWATWCQPCKEMVPGLVKLYEKYKDKGFVILSLAHEDEGEEIIKSFVKHYGITYPALLANRDTAKKYGVRGIPVSFLIDKEGKIIYRRAGNAPGIMDEFESEIKKLI